MNNTSSTNSTNIEPSRSQKARAPLFNLGSQVANLVRQFEQYRIQTRLTALIMITTVPLLIGVSIIISSRASARIEANAADSLQKTNKSLTTNVKTWLEQNTLSLKELTLNS